MGRVLGLDLGAGRIGVAVTDSERTVASPVRYITRSGDRDRDHEAIALLVDEYEARVVVVGLPLSLSGEVGPAARSVLDEVEQLRGRLDRPVDTVDERFTTREAAASLRTSGRSAKKQRSVIDATAAALLLQTWIDRQRVP